MNQATHSADHQQNIIRPSTSRALDQFYTLPSIAQRCINFALKNLPDPTGGTSRTFVEPSAGSGSFFDALPTPKIAIDIDPPSNRPDIMRVDFLKWTPGRVSGEIVVIGNPPFGKNASLAMRFINHAAQFADHIAFILPRTFEKDSFQARVSDAFHLKAELELSVDSFTHNGAPYSVPVVFQVWSRGAKRARSSKKALTHRDFYFVSDPLSADFAFQRVGARAGLVSSEGLMKSPQSHYFIRVRTKKAAYKVKNTLADINWEPIKTRTAGNPSIGKAELIKAYADAIR